MGTFRKTYAHTQMEALFSLLVDNVEDKYARDLVAKVGLEGAAPDGPTPIDVALTYIRHLLYESRPLSNSGVAKSRASQFEIDYALDFVSWLFGHGAVPRNRYITSISGAFKYSFKYSQGLHWITTGYSFTHQGQGDEFTDNIIRRTIELLLSKGVPIEISPEPSESSRSFKNPDAFIELSLYPPPGGDEPIELNPIPEGDRDGDWESWSPEEFLKGPLFINKPELGLSPLHVAAALGSDGICRYLIAKGATVDQRSAFGLTPLMVACARGHLKAVEALLDAGANPALQDWDGRTALNIRPSGPYGANDLAPPIKDLIELRLRYARGAIRRPDHDYRSDSLVHRTAGGDLVRSKTEVIIADALFYLGCGYEYEKPLSGRSPEDRIIPDFTITENLTGKSVIWEHAGRMGDASYRKRWREKEDWYSRNGYERDYNLFVTLEDGESGIDSHLIRETAMTIKKILADPD